ncbi:Rv1733c family protein [[Kitasatospora] papulosa]|uniref:Rv1733c family protein n=1 Tax=[Kitasatospora] papulosa TaxID=1464011 RepID=UPI00368EF856
MRAVLGIRRWRRNPVCRPTDRHEAWVALTALLLMLIAAPVLGWKAGALTDDSLRRTVRAQHEQRRLTPAVVVRAASGTSRFAQDPEAAVTEDSMQRSVVADWVAPDGTARRGTVSTASTKTAPGTPIDVWTNDRGDLVMRPMDISAAHTHAVLAGIGAALLAGGLTESVRRFVVWRMRQRRYVRIDRAWAEVGPDWGRTGTGS